MTKLQELIFKLENCEKYFTSTGKIRDRVLKIYKKDKYIGTFSNYNQIKEFLNVDESVKPQQNSIVPILKFKGYRLIEEDASQYKDVPRLSELKTRFLIAEKDGINYIFDDAHQASKELGISKNVIRNVISGLIEEKDGYFFYWDK